MQGYRILLISGDADARARLTEAAQGVTLGPCQVIAIPPGAPLKALAGGQPNEVALLHLASSQESVLRDALEGLRGQLPHHPLVLLVPEISHQAAEVAAAWRAHHLLPLEQLSPGLLQLALSGACRAAHDQARIRHLEARSRESQPGRERSASSPLLAALTRVRKLESSLRAVAPEGHPSASLQAATTQARQLREHLCQSLSPEDGSLGTPTVVSLHSLLEAALREATPRRAEHQGTTLGALLPVLARIDPDLAACIALEAVLLADQHPHFEAGCTLSLTRQEPLLPGGRSEGAAQYACIQLAARWSEDGILQASPQPSPPTRDEEVWLNRLVRLAGGYTRVQETAGWIRTVRIFLPCLGELEGEPTRTSTGRADSATSEAAGGTSTARCVLVAEDQKEIRKLVRMVLESQGYAVLEAPDGARALQLIETYQGNLDLVISDLVMPHLGGLEIAEKLHVARPGTPFLLMSGYNSSPQSGFEGISVLNKPFRPDELITKVRTLVKASS